MESKELSSNWKSLQATLQKKGEVIPLSKRRVDAEVEKSNKRHKTNSRQSFKPPIPDIGKPKLNEATRRVHSGMGLNLSKTVANTDPKDDAAGPNPASTLARTKSLSSKSSCTSLQKAQDSLNSGVISSVTVGKYVSIDCEMVGVGPDPDNASMLARVSVVNYHGEQVYDSFVQPKEVITDYRTHVSGITSSLLRAARPFEQVQEDISNLLEGRILIGHAVRHDLDALMIGHPRRDIRDTSRHQPYRQIAGGRTPSLKRLANDILGVSIQVGPHSSIEDARVTMMLFRREKVAFERQQISRFGPDRKQARPQTIEGESAGTTAYPGGKTKGGGKKKKKRKR